MSELFLARDLLRLSENAVAELPVRHTLVFEDGSRLESTRNETLYSRYFWTIFTPYPQVRILPKHHLRTILGDKPLNANTHRRLCSNILKSIVEEEGLVRPEQKEPLLKLIYQTISDAMSKLSIDTEENVMSIDILDFIQIAKHPKIDQLRNEAYQNPDRIASAYENTLSLIKTLPEFKDNGLSKAVRADMVKPNQVMQCVAFRGWMTEVTGAVYRHKANWSNYTFGNTSFYDFVADSRTAAKSHYYSDTALKDSEYMARKFQFFTSVVEHIVYKDCGSTDHIVWEVQGKRLDEHGAVEYGGDIPNLVGKWYLDEESGTYKVIEGDEKHLDGKKIKLRSVMHCKTPNPHDVCHICAGKLSENISRFANIGHLGSVTTTKDLTQSILSIKHVNTSSSVVKIMMKDHERKFMNSGPAGDAFYLNFIQPGSQPKLIIPRDNATGLVDLAELEDLDRVSLQRISSLQNVVLMIGSGNIPPVSLNVTNKMKPSMLSHDMLYYLKEHGWTTNDQNCFVVDLADWNYNKPIFVMPNKEDSFVDMAAAVDTLVRGNQRMLQQRNEKNAPQHLLLDLFRIMNSKLRVNVLALEIIVYSLMVESTRCYAMARNAKDPVLGLGDYLTEFRSLGPALAYEKQDVMLTNPMLFFQGRRPDSPMDVFLAPREVVEQYPGR